jgi:hypothetical protein
MSDASEPVVVCAAVADAFEPVAVEAVVTVG